MYTYTFEYYTLYYSLSTGDFIYELSFDPK